jgi:hypothetical protein
MFRLAYYPSGQLRKSKPLSVTLGPEKEADSAPAPTPTLRGKDPQSHDQGTFMSYLSINLLFSMPFS